MFILVNPNTNVLIKIAEECKPIINNKGVNVECEDRKATAYLLDDGLIYPKSLPSKMYEVEEIPEDVVPYKYLYTVEDGFVINPDYLPPEDIETAVENIENELVDIKSNINELDEFNVKTNKSKTLDTYLYLGDDNYYINNEGNASVNELRVQNILNIGASGSGYYIDLSGNIVLNSLTLNNNATLKGNTYFGNDTTYYVNSNGTANFNTLSVASTSIFKNKVTFGNNTYYIDQNGDGNLSDLTLSTLKTTSNLTFTNATGTDLEVKSSLKTNNINCTDFSINRTIGSTVTTPLLFNSMVFVDTGKTVPHSSFGTTYNNSLTEIIGHTINISSNSDLNAYAPKFNISGSSKISMSSSDEILLTCGGTAIHYDYNKDGYTFRPKTNDTVLLGSGNYRWSNMYSVNANVSKDLFLDGNLVFTGKNSEITISGGALNTSAVLYCHLSLGYDKSPNFDPPNEITDRSSYYINGYGNGRFASVFADSIHAWDGALSANVAIGSSKRFKENIEYKDNNYWHDKLMQVKPCTFNYKNSKDESHAGLIAEDLYEILPEFVKLDEEGNCESIKMFDMISVLIAEVQRLNSIIEKK